MSRHDDDDVATGGIDGDVGDGGDADNNGSDDDDDNDDDGSDDADGEGAECNPSMVSKSRLESQNSVSWDR